MGGGKVGEMEMGRGQDIRTSEDQGINMSRKKWR
jgi:hypothetical protein